jgi:hypothetical protein
MNDMTEIDTKKLRELLASATPGPWETGGESDPLAILHGVTYVQVAEANDALSEAAANAELIAFLRTHGETLLATYEAVQEAPEVKVYAGHDGYAEIMLEPYIEAKAKLIGQRVRLVRSGRGDT